MGQDYHVINWQYLNDALEYYKSNGFQYIEVPWIVPNEITRITYNRNTKLNTEYGDLIGSSEQSFVFLHLNKDLSKGKYVTLTPCFRDDVIDLWHSRHFMKVELFITDETTTFELFKTIELCKKFFDSKLMEPVQIVKTDDGYDIEYNYIELGSYGIRENGFQWIYATGLAEPRFSSVKNRFEVL